MDVDLELVPDADELLRAISELKQSLELNVELAAPHHFIPELPGWQERSRFVDQLGQLAVFHYDLYSQALAKVERGHAKDLRDVESMIAEGLVEPARLLELFDAIEPELYRYPSVDAPSFRSAVEQLVRSQR